MCTKTLVHFKQPAREPEIHATLSSQLPRAYYANYSKIILTSLESEFIINTPFLLYFQAYLHWKQELWPSLLKHLSILISAHRLIQLRERV